MKKILLTSAILICGLYSNAQPVPPPPTGQYPYSENFESSAFPQFGSAMPSTWTQYGSNTFSTYISHGTGTPASKGLTKALNNFATIDSITSPSIGPLTASSVLSFDYRVAQYLQSTPVTIPILSTGFKITFYAIINIGPLNVRYPITSINTTTHTGSLNFANKSISLPSTVAGQSGAIRIVVERGAVSGNMTADYNIDIDNISVANSSTTGFINYDNVNNDVLVQTDLLNKTIILNSTARISNLFVYSLDGKEIFTNSNYISGSSISFENSGIYFLSFKINDRIVRKKIMIN